MSSKRFMAWVSVLVAMVVIAAGCGSGSAKKKNGAQAKTVYAYAGVTDASPLFKAVGDVMEQQAKAQGVTLFRVDNKFDTPTALSNARLMVQQHPAIVLDWAASTANDTIGKTIANAGVPCIAINVPIDGCPLFNHSNRTAGTLLATAAAQGAAQRKWTAADTTVVMLAIPSAGPEGEDAMRYFYTTYATAFPAMKQVSAPSITLSTTKIGSTGLQVSTDGTRDGAFKSLSTALRSSSLPSGRHIVIDGFNDDQCLGALRALQQAHRDKDSLITCQGADADGLEQLRTNPQWWAEDDPFLKLWPEYVLAMSAARLHGVALPELTLSPEVALTKDTVDHYYTGTTLASRPSIPANDKYLVDGGYLHGTMDN